MTDRSLREELQFVSDDLSAGGDGEAISTPPAGAAPEPSNEAQGAAGAEAGAAAAATPEPVEPKPEGGDPARDEHGRFKAKTDQAPAAEGAPAAAQPVAEEPPKPESAKPEGEGAQTAPTRVPPSLPAALKARFASLDPDVQSAFVALEDSVQKAKAEWGVKGQRLNRFDEIFGPRLARWQMNGIADEFQGIQMLLAAQDVLDRDPVQGLVQVARSYGVTPAHLAQAFGLTQTSAPQPGQEGQPPPTAQPGFEAALQPLAQQVQTLAQQFQQQQQSAQAQGLAQAQAAIDAFAADPKNLYFADVEDDITRRLVDGSAKSLQDAYDQATWANATIRPLLLEAERTAAAKATADAAAEAKRLEEKAARDKASAASRASGSVTGSPAAGSQAPGGGSTGNLRKDLEAAFQANAGV